jgi:hypothetical protein
MRVALLLINRSFISTMFGRLRIHTGGSRGSGGGKRAIIMRMGLLLTERIFISTMFGRLRIYTGGNRESGGGKRPAEDAQEEAEKAELKGSGHRSASSMLCSLCFLL